MNAQDINKNNILHSIYAIISKVTGHRIEDLDSDMYLEEDLGLDSLKMISLLNEMMELIPPERINQFTAEHPIQSLMCLQTIGDIIKVWESGIEEESDYDTIPDAKASIQDETINNISSHDNLDSQKIAAVLKNSSAKDSIFDLISKVTGHKAEDLDCDMYLEGDLGLDSIKMITLMNEIMKLVPENEVNDFKAKHPIGSLMGLQTIGDIIQVFDSWDKEMGKTSEVNEICMNSLPERNLQSESGKLDILNSQYTFIISYLAVTTHTISSGICIRGDLNINYLKDAWEEVIYLHPMLRSVFRVEEKATSFKQYSIEVLKDVKVPEISVQDLRHLDSKAQRQTIKNRFESDLNRKLDIFKWPLHDLSVVRLGDNEYEIILSINHIISDGLGNQQLLRELLEILSAKVEGRYTGLPCATSISEYNRVVSEMNLWNNEEENRFLDGYLKKQGKEKYMFNPYGPSKKLSTEPFTGVNTNTKKYWVDKQVADLLISRTKSWGVSLFVLLLSTYIRTIKQQGEARDKVIMNVPTGGRVYPNVDATGILSSFAQNMALSFCCEDTSNGWESLIAKVDEEIKSSLSSGIDRAQIYQSALFAKEKMALQDGKIPEMASEIIRSTLKSNLYFSFVGDTHLREAYGDFKVFDYEAYTCTIPGAIDCLVEIFCGKILLTANYDGDFHDEAYIDKHMSRLIENIKELAALDVEMQQSMYVKPVISVNTEEIELKICNIVEEVCKRSVQKEDMYKDLTEEFGMDSLECIRIISKLGKDIGIDGTDRKALFGCRTLKEMATVVAAKKTPQPPTKNLNELEIPYLKIVQQCKQTPDALAILFNEERITYRQLEDITNRLANFLKSKGIKAGSLVGVMTLPGPLMLIGMIGILKSGAAYVPVDPSYPAERIKYILTHAKIQILLTEKVIKKQVSELFDNANRENILVYLDNISENDLSSNQVDRDTWSLCSNSDPDYSSSPDDIMTVLYTSGSTGNPKGVVLAHRGYMNRLVWHQKMFDLKLGERVAQKTSCCFDISVWELFWPLMYGGTVCPIRKEIVKNPWELAKWFIDARINIMHFVPSLFGEFVNALEDDDYSFRDLRWLIFSGEALPMSYIQKWIDKHGMATGLANLYGPTEASIDVTYHIIEKRPGDDGETSIPIGKPVDNVFIKNLDKDMRELAAGEIGELWIGGIQLAKGYLYNPEKTKETFWPNPFPEIPGEFLYRTGDLTTKRPDGSYEYHGRIDNQVKIRGFRVELGEIEGVLSSIPYIEEAAVIAVDFAPGEKHLVAFLSGTQVDDKQIKDAIGTRLPHYMIPHRIKWLQSIPKNPNGKLDRKALQALVANNGEENRETCLAANQGASQTVSKNNDDNLPLTPGQLWLLKHFDAPYQWTGYSRFYYKKPMDFKLLKKSVRVLLERHDALRCIVCKDGSKWVQRVLSADNLTENIDFYDGSQMDENERNEEIENFIKETIGGFYIDKWPLWKMIVVKISDSLYDMAIIGHHIISDVVSTHILFQDMWQIYDQLNSGAREANLGQVKSLREYVTTIEELKGKNLKEYVQYWESQFPSETDSLKVPVDYVLGANDEGSAMVKVFNFSKETTSIVLGEAKKYFGCNVYPILLAPLYKMLSVLYDKSHIVVSQRLHGRDIGDNNTFFKTAGNFAIHAPLGINIEESDRWVDIVQKIQNGLYNIPMNGLSYDIVAEELPEYMYPDEKLTSIRVNYLGNRDFPTFDVFEFSKDMDRRYSASSQKRMSILEFFFMIVDDKLSLKIEYSRNLYKEKTIKQLGEQYVETIKGMIDSIPKKPMAQVLKPLMMGQYYETDGVLSDKVALIVGQAHGSIESIALSMAKEGASIAIISKHAEQLEETVNEIRRINPNVMLIASDLSSPLVFQQQIEKVIKKFGKLDIFVNELSFVNTLYYSDVSFDEWMKIIQTNTFDIYSSCYAILAHFIRQNKGRIVNLVPNLSTTSEHLLGVHAALKHGVIDVTKSLAEELKPYNINVNAICPMPLLEVDSFSNEPKNMAVADETITEAAMFLASSKSDHIFGEVIPLYAKESSFRTNSQQIPNINL